MAATTPAALFAAGLILVATGVLSQASALDLAARTAPILLFVVAMTIVTELSDDAGLFRVLTAWLARFGARPFEGGSRRGRVGPRRGLVEPQHAPRRGRVMFLWLLVVVLASLSTAFLSLDTTAVLVTPLVVSLARHARIHPLPFALTTVWLANTASLFLPVSNLTNLLARQHLGLDPAEFLHLLWAPALLRVLVPLAFLSTIFRSDLRGTYTAPRFRWWRTSACCGSVA